MNSLFKRFKKNLLINGSKFLSVLDTAEINLFGRELQNFNPLVYNKDSLLPLIDGSITTSNNTTYMVSDAASLLNDQIKGTTQKFSISIWVKLNWYDETYQTIFSRDNNSGGRQFACEFDSSGKYTFFIADDASNYSWWKTNDIFIRTNGWYHLVQTFDNTQALADKCKIYINGSEVATSRVDLGAGVSDVNDQPTEPIYINVTNFGGLVNPVQGSVSRITFFDNILSSSDVTAMYNSGTMMDERSGLSISPYMMWNFGNTTGSIVVDDVIGTSYPVSKSFTSSGSVTQSSSIYPSPLVYQTETDTLLAAMVDSPTTTQKDYIDDFIAGLKTDGNWSIADLIKVYASHGSNDALLNWKTPASNTSSLVNTPAFTTDQGFTGVSASSKYINENYNPASGTNYTLNSGSIFAYQRSNINAAETLMGNASGSDLTIIIPRNGGSFAGRINSATNNTYAHGDSRGMFGVIRTASNVQNLYINGTEVATGTGASTAIANNNIYSLCYNNAGTPALYSNNTISFLYIGSGEVNQSKLRRRFVNLLISKGTKVI